jgi:hypothetical protein
MPLTVRTPREVARTREDPVDDSIEVPAAVVCATCGDSTCTGCDHDQSRSGIVAMVPWERPGSGGALARLWGTARATTLQGDVFFELLPDGPIAPALRFAFAAELLAAVGFFLSALPFVLALAPAWAAHVVRDAGAREVAVRAFLVGVPGLALLLVAAHAAHGLALDRGARRVGGRASAGRALRFGLYASGWDLVMGPLGALVLGVTEGVGAVGTLLDLGPGLPGRCTRAFLRGCYRLEGARADKARAASMVAAAIATLIGAAAIVGAAIAFVFAAG